jgi:hypothetical protein
MSLSATTTIIALGNKARQGKDVVCSAMVKEFSKLYDIRKYGFGVQLKQELNELDQFEVCLKAGIQYDINPPMDDPHCQTKHGKQSRLLQWYGAYKREKDKIYWIKRLDAVIKRDKPQFAIITDMRYQNEFMWVKSHKGHTVKVVRQGFVDLSRDPAHLSEVDLDNVVFDYEINVPEGNVPQLKKDAIEVFNMIVTDITPRVDDLADLNNMGVNA